MQTDQLASLINWHRCRAGLSQVELGQDVVGSLMVEGVAGRGRSRGMKICPITLEPVEGGGLYSRAGLRAVHPRLENLPPLHLTQEEQLRETRVRADKISIQGVQPKISALLKAKEWHRLPVARLRPPQHHARFRKCIREERAATAGQIAQTHPKRLGGLLLP